MTIVRHTAESGLANGTAVTTANSALPDAFAVVNPGSGTITYSTTAFKGTRGIKFSGTALANGTTTADCYVRWLNVGGETTSAAMRFYLFLQGLPTDGRTRIATFLSPSAGASMGSLAILPAGTLRISSDVSGTDIATTTATLSLNTWYRVEWTQTNPTTTTGTSTLRVYLGDSTTVVANTSLDVTGANFGAAQTVGGCTIGQSSAQTGGSNYVLDDLAFQTGSATLIGVSGNLPPTASAGADQSGIEPWATVTLSGSDSDSDGTVVTRAWAQTSGAAVTLSGASTATATFIAPATIAGSTLGFSYTATDNQGASTTATTTVAVLPVTERAVIGGVEVPVRIRIT